MQHWPADLPQMWLWFFFLLLTLFQYPGCIAVKFVTPVKFLIIKNRVKFTPVSDQLETVVGNNITHFRCLTCLGWKPRPWQVKSRFGCRVRIVLCSKKWFSRGTAMIFAAVCRLVAPITSMYHIFVVLGYNNWHFTIPMFCHQKLILQHHQYYLVKKNRNDQAT